MSTRQPKRGEVFDFRFDPQVGSELAGQHPAVVISADGLNERSRTLIVVPLTTHKPEKRPLQVKTGLEVLLSWHKEQKEFPEKRSRAVCTQITTMDKQRLVDLIPVTTLPEGEVQKILAGIDRALGRAPLLSLSV